MNSLSDRYRDKPLKKGTAFERRKCWEFLSCTKFLCPVHGRRGVECWLTPKPDSLKARDGDLSRELSSCLMCRYFRWRGEQDPQGFNKFLSEQVRRYNYKALQRMFEKEESFIEIMSSLPDGLFTVNHELLINFFNPAAEKITGFSASDAVGMYCKDVFKNTICESDCALKRALASGQDIENREYEILDIEGKKVPIICSTSVFRDGKGKIAGGIEIFKDITDRKRLQEEVARREKKYRRIFEGSHDMIYITDSHGKIMDVNEAGVEMLGYKTREELLRSGAAAKLFRRTWDRDRMVTSIDREGYVKDYEAQFKKRNGSPIHVLISSRRYENPETGEVEYEGIIKDITERKQAERSLTQRNRELSILNAIALGLNSAMELTEILNMTLRKILKVLGLERGGIFLVDQEKRRAHLEAVYGLPTQDPAHSGEILFKDPLLRKFLLEEDKRRLPAESDFPPFLVTYEVREGEGSVQWLSCFLIISKGKCLGFFGLDIPSSRVLASHETHLLGSLGNFLGGAIENTRLMETIRGHRQELRGLTEKLFQGQEDERRRIAHELHDEAGQALTAIKLGLDRLEETAPSDNGRFKEEIGEIKKILVQTSSEIRRLSYRLHPAVLSDLGLEPALGRYFKEVASHSALDIEFHMVGFDSRLDLGMETVLYRFSQEALTNTLNHSGAEHFRLSIIKSYPKVIFKSEDDGVGFDGKIGKSEKMSLGLPGMRERTALLGGSFQLRTRAGEGTRIRIEIPLPEDQTRGTTHKDLAR